MQTHQKPATVAADKKAAEKKAARKRRKRSLAEVIRLADYLTSLGPKVCHESTVVALAERASRHFGLEFAPFTVGTVLEVRGWQTKRSEARERGKKSNATASSLSDRIKKLEATEKRLAKLEADLYGKSESRNGDGRGGLF